MNTSTLREEFPDDSWFGEPLGRKISFRRLETWLKGEYASKYGVVTFQTSYRKFQKFAAAYEGVVVQSVVEHLQHDSVTKQALLTASEITGAANLGKGFLHWTAHPCAGGRTLQEQRLIKEKFTKLAAKDKSVVHWLRKLTDAILLYHVKDLISAQKRVSLTRNLQAWKTSKKSAGAGADSESARYTWVRAKACLSRELPDQDVSTVTNAVAAMIREE